MAYSGTYRDRLRDGHGSYVFPGGSFRYEGDWKRGKMHGRGIFSLPDGGSYEGEFEIGEINGIGLRRWPNGSTYNGQFHRGERHGEGVFISPSGEKYEGHWEHNQRHGLGELCMTNGDVYRGDFYRHKPHGNGRIRFVKDGSAYDGDWVEGRICGRGTLKDAQGHQLYDGEWLNGERCGCGLGVLLSSTAIVFDGVWTDDKPLTPTLKLALKIVEQPLAENSTTTNEDKPADVIYQDPPNVITLSKSTSLRLPILAGVSLHLSSLDGSPSIVRGESGRLFRLRVFEGPMPTPAESSPEGGASIAEIPTPSQWQFTHASDSTCKDPIDDEPTNQESNPNPDGETIIEEPRINEVVVPNIAGISLFDMFAMPSASLLGAYHIVCDTINSGEAFDPVYIPLEIVE